MIGDSSMSTEFRDYTGEVVRSLYIDVAEFRHRWSNPERRAEILKELEDKGINVAEAGEAFLQGEGCQEMINILLQEANIELGIEDEISNLMKEAVELKNILSSIIIKIQKKH